MKILTFYLKRNIFYLMEVDSTKFYLNTIHRLPSNNQSPRPVIVKFISILDRDLVWRNKSKLGNTRYPVLIREHFDENTQRNIKKLLPIRRAAIVMCQKVRLLADKLYINSTLYTVNNLKDLPLELSPNNISNKTINNHTFFYTSASPFSNYFRSCFKVDGINYSHSEMYIQATKTRIFKDDITLNKIIPATSPGEMKALGASIKDFNKDICFKSAPEIANTCHCFSL